MSLAQQNGKIFNYNGKVGRSISNLFQIELNVSGTGFPTINVSTIFRFDSSVSGNVMYIDFNDGQGVQSFAPNSGNNWNYFNTVMYTFADGLTTTRRILISFKFPDKITYCNFQNLPVSGAFPSRFGMFNFSSGFKINNPTTSTTKYSMFPTSLRGLVSDNVEFAKCFTTPLTTVPVFVAGSIVKTLTFDGVLNLNSDASLNNFTAFSTCKNLEKLTLIDAGLINTSINDTLKLNPTLKHLVLGNNTSFSTVLLGIRNCTTLTILNFGDGSTGGYSALSSWGGSFQNLTNLTTLYSVMYASFGSLPVALPTDFSYCTLFKNYDCRNAFKTQVRIDDHINNWYDFIVANASTSSGNTKFRQMVLNFGWLNSTTLNTRPTGTYQDSATPSTPMEKIYKIVKTYACTVIVTNAAGTGNEILTP